MKWVICCISRPEVARGRKKLLQVAYRTESFAKLKTCHKGAEHSPIQTYRSYQVSFKFDSVNKVIIVLAEMRLKTEDMKIFLIMYALTRIKQANLTRLGKTICAT